MVINKYNLSIVDHCTDKPVRGNATDVLHVTETGTLAANDAYSVEVSALRKEPGDITGCITVETAEGLNDRIPWSAVKPVMGGAPVAATFLEAKPVLFEITINAEYLAKLAQSAVNFEGEIIRLQFTGKEEPVRMDTRNTATGQRWEALLMPRRPGADTERFVPPPPLEDPFELAMREATKLA